MPSFHTHIRFNLLLALPFWGVGLHYMASPPPEHFLTFCAAFIYASFFFHPDLDLAYKIKWFSVKGFLTLPFRFYSFFFRHRGLSHHIIWGTLSRILWIIGFFMVFFFITHKTTFTGKDFWAFWKQNRPYLTFILLAIFLADLSHIGLDRIFRKRS